MSDDKATPRPWERIGKHLFVIEKFIDGRGRETERNRIWFSVSGGPATPTSEVDASAKFILRAVNAHDEMVEALKQIRSCVGSVHDERALIDRIADAAIAKATKP